ncbi:DMT family transporter [Helicobacter sp.]|uniref:DMT family transporter n=1 Tax=Helicobacter sp. TaxID=218 RepID=UPI0025BDAAC9|nr:DMT family transporter [Helicobacter sp.]MCI5969048.1 DMT family transporter [Helicobacter sp.]MDY2585344.1 DMT family transporter [Helicobacter sp.]
MGNQQAIIAIFLAAILFTAMGIFVKVLTPALPAMEVVFARNLFGLIWILGALLLKPPKQTGGKPFVLALRGFAGGSAMLAYFYNISVMPLGTAYAFSYTSPIFIALFSVLFIRDKVTLKTWVAILLGFSGILLISNPKGTDLTFLGLCIGVYSGIGAALAYLSIAKLAKLYDSRVIILSLMLIGSLLPLLTQIVPYTSYPIALFEPFVMPNLKEFLLILALGLVSTYAQIYLTKAYSIGNPPIIGALSYSAIFLATLAGIALGDKTPNALVLSGMLLIICGGILAVLHKRH